MVRVGLTIYNLDEYENKKYNNGIHQNISFIKKYFDSIPNIQTFFVSNKCKKDKTAISLHDIKTLKRLDFLIIIGTIPADSVIESLEGHVRLIWWVMGNTIVTEIDEMLHTTAQTVIYKKNRKYEQVWISPHFEYSIDYYKYMYGKENIEVCPYIWEPTYMGDPYVSNFNHNDINIGVFESNRHSNKSFFLPMIICERAKELINKAYIYNIEKFLPKSSFKDFVDKSSLYKEKRIKLERHKIFKDAMDNYCNVVVSFVENWDLNYLFLECFYLGIPLVHNSKMLKDWGYYYESYNVTQAVAQIQRIKETFDREAYIHRHKPLLFKYSVKNPEYIKFFKDHLYPDTKIPKMK